MNYFTGNKFYLDRPACARCGVWRVNIVGDICRPCMAERKRLSERVMNLIPWIIIVGLLLMGARMAFATWEVMNNVAR